MKFSVGLSLAFVSLAAANPVLLDKRADPQGIDVSHFQGAVNWATAKSKGVTFAYIKCTEGTTFIDPEFGTNYVGAYNAGVIRGAYHFAHPDSSSGAVQANYLLAHGGKWSADGLTLPAALDIEYNPSGAECYGLSTSAMSSWVADFSNTYHAATGRYPVIYTTADWWNTCTGSNPTFAANNPLWVARYSSSVGALPAGWSVFSFWQFADSGGIQTGADADEWNGSAANLVKFANGG